MNNETHLDGNALAGIFVEIFGHDMTAHRGRCGGCGTIDVLANLKVFRDAPGVVMRCRVCSSVLMVIVTVDGEYRVSFELLKWVETPVQS